MHCPNCGETMLGVYDAGDVDYPACDNCGYIHRGQLAMNIHEALDLAIESMMYRTVGLESLAKDWHKYGNALAFRKEESRRAAELLDSLNKAIAVLKAERDKAV